MSGYTKLRVMGYTAILVMHITNIHYMDSHSYKLRHTKDERLLIFKGLGNRFFTTWTFMLQIAYLFLSLLCDIYQLKNIHKKTYTLPKYIDKLREVVFASLVWPCSLVVFTVFWGLYNYDRSLIFPEYLDVALPRISNHVIHTMIVPIAMFEVVCRPRTEPVTHKSNLMLMTLYVAVYLLVLLFTFKQRNIWLYPIFGIVYGTMYFIVALAVLYGLFILFYCIQWPLTKIIHEKYKKEAQKVS